MNASGSWISCVGRPHPFPLALRNSLKEYLQFLSIARGSVEQVKYLLLLRRDLEYVPVGTYVALANAYEEVGRMLNGLMRSLRLRLKPLDAIDPKPHT